MAIIFIAYKYRIDTPKQHQLQLAVCANKFSVAAIPEMKMLFLFALVACVAAGPLSKSVVVTTPEKVVVVVQDEFTAPHIQGQYSPVHYGFSGPQGNAFDVAHYLAYQFHLAQKEGYTGAQVSHYFVEHGFPESVAQYLAQQYEAGLSQPYFESPYHIFHYYSEHSVPEEVQQYIAQEIAQAYQQYQSHFSQYGPNALKQEYSGVPQLIYQYVIDQAQYYGEHGVSHSAAQNAYQHLQMAYQYAQNALHYFVTGQVSQQVHHQVYEFLQHGLQEIHSIQSVPQSYLTYHQYYIPYYVAQYNFAHAQQAYHDFLHAYQYIQEHGQGAFPESFVQQIQDAYFAAEHAYHFYQQSHFSSASHGSDVSGYSSNHYLAAQYYQQVLQYMQAVQQYLQNGKAFSQASVISQQLNQAYNAYQMAYQFYHQQNLAGPVVGNIQQHIQQGYHYLVLAYEAAQRSGQEYVIQQLQHAVHAAGNLQYVAQSFFGGENGYYGPYSPSVYGSFAPSSSAYQYGSAYGYGSYVPHGSGYEYGPYGASSVSAGSYYPHNSYGYQYGPYSNSYGYGAYSSHYGYPHHYGFHGQAVVPNVHSGSYFQSAAAAA